MLPSASKSQKIVFILMKCTKTVATRAAPFGPDMHQIVCRLRIRPRPHWGRSPRPPSWFRGWDPREGEKGGEGKGGKGVGGIATPPPGTGREEKGMGEGWGGRVGKGRGRKGRGGRGNKHRLHGLKLVAPPRLL